MDLERFIKICRFFRRIIRMMIRRLDDLVPFKTRPRRDTLAVNHTESDLVPELLRRNARRFQPVRYMPRLHHLRQVDIQFSARPLQFRCHYTRVFLVYFFIPAVNDAQ